MVRVGLVASLLGSYVTTRSIDRLPHQLSGGQYINDTQFGNISTSGNPSHFHHQQRAEQDYSVIVQIDV
jgi:hypothetical protein